jgi:hypothetical protein
VTDPDIPPSPDVAVPVAPAGTPPLPVDPEDWESTPADDDDRYQRERPPHWE